MKRYRTLLFTGLIIAASATCSKKPEAFRPLNYFPLEMKNTWHFSGGIQTMQVTEVIKSGHERRITLTFFDSLDAPLWSETYRTAKDQLRWLAFEPATALLPRVGFNPPLYGAPFSNEVGDMTTINTIETQFDSVETTTAITVDYQIAAIEDVVTPAGVFAGCLKVKIDFIYPPVAVRPLFIGDHYWWYAPNVGPIKYDLPTTHGDLLRYELH